MRAVLIALAILAGCGPTAPPESSTDTEAAAPAAAAAPAGQVMSTGLMGGLSDSAAGEMGTLEVARDGLQFSYPEGARSVAAQTEFLGVVDATTLIAANGQSFAAAAPGPISMRVELRRIVAPAPTALCWGNTPATHVALAHDEPLTALTLIVFSGADAPGPQARVSTLCATYAYAVD